MMPKNRGSRDWLSPPISLISHRPFRKKRGELRIKKELELISPFYYLNLQSITLKETNQTHLTKDFHKQKQR
jgi:hypothetical protein